MVATRQRAALITYEEYHPFGTTSWWATDGGTEVSAKRYRYTGKERDDETGLGYHGARYYAAWLGSWERPDPIGLRGGINRWAYCRGNPIGRSDGTGTKDNEVDQLNMFRASDADEIGEIAKEAGFPDVGSFYDELNATAVDGVGRVQIGDRDIEIGLHEPTSGSSGSSFTRTLGIDYLIGQGVDLWVKTHPALQGAGILASQAPGASTAAAVIQSEPVQQTLGFVGDATLVLPLTGMIRYGSSRAAGLLTDSRAGQKLLTDSRAGGLSLAEGGELSVAGGGELSAPPRTWTSPDPLVGDLATEIEAAYPGHVVGVNVPMYDAAGNLVTDADILLRNAVLQVKRGGAGHTSQVAATMTVTDLPVLAYSPRLGGFAMAGINRIGGVATNDRLLLIGVVAP